jgi:hypothetical protein
MTTETVMPKFKSYRPFKPEWKYERKCCNSCSREYLTDNMMCQEEGKNINVWYCIRCYNSLQKS